MLETKEQTAGTIILEFFFVTLILENNYKALVSMAETSLQQTSLQWVWYVMHSSGRQRPKHTALFPILA